jgi:hypothetical protein
VLATECSAAANRQRLTFVTTSKIAKIGGTKLANAGNDPKQ